MPKNQPVTKEELVEVLLDFHEKVQMPIMNDVLGRLGKVEKRLGGLKKKVNSVEINLENKIEKLERKLDRVTDHQANKLGEHEERIFKLELAV